MGCADEPITPGSPDSNSVYTLQQWLFRRRAHTRRFTKRFIVLCGDTIYSYRKVASLNSDKSLSTILNNASSRWKISGASVIAESFNNSAFYRWRVSFPMHHNHGMTLDDFLPADSGRIECEDLWFGTPDLHVAEDWILAMMRVAEYGSLENWVARSPKKHVFTQFSLPWYLKPFEYLPLESNNPSKLEVAKNYKNFQPFRIDRLEGVPAYADTAVYCVIEVQSSLYIMRLYEQEFETGLELSSAENEPMDIDDRSGLMPAPGGLISRWLARGAKQSDKKKKNNIMLRNFIYPGGASIYIPLFQTFTMHFVQIHFYSVQDEYMGTVGIPETDISAVEPSRTLGYDLVSLDNIHPLSPKRFYLMEDKVMPKSGSPSTESFYRIPRVVYSDMGIPKSTVERFSELDNFGIEQLKGIKTLATRDASGLELGSGAPSSPLGVVYASACNPRRLDHVYLPAKQVLDSKKYYEALVDRASGPLSIQMLIGNLKRGNRIMKLFLNFKSQVKDVFHFRDFYKSIFWIFYTIISLWVFPDSLIILTLLPIILYMITFHPLFYSFIEKCVLRFPVLVIFLPSFLSSHLRIPKSICLSCANEKSFGANKVEIINLASLCNHYYSLYTCLAGYVFSNYGGWDIFERLESRKKTSSSSYSNSVQSSPLYNSFLFYIPPFPLGQLPLYVNLYYTLNFFIAMLIITLKGGLVEPERLKLLLLMRLDIIKKPGIIGLDYLNPASLGCEYYIQHERKNMFGFFSSSNLLSFEPTHWPPSSPSLSSNHPDLSQWKLVINSNTDANGWQYSTHWGGIWYNENNVLMFIRKRTWTKDSKFPFETSSFKSLSEAGDVGMLDQVPDLPAAGTLAESGKIVPALPVKEEKKYVQDAHNSLHSIDRAMGWASLSRIDSTINSHQDNAIANTSNDNAVRGAGGPATGGRLRSKFFKFKPEWGLRQLIKNKFSQESLEDLSIKRFMRRASLESSSIIEECNVSDTWISGRDSFIFKSDSDEIQTNSENLVLDPSDRQFRKEKYFKVAQIDIVSVKKKSLKAAIKRFKNLKNKKPAKKHQHVKPVLTKMLRQMQNFRNRGLHLALQFPVINRFKRHFRRKLAVQENTFLGSIMYIIESLMRLSKPHLVKNRFKIKVVHLKYKRPRILKLCLGSCEFRHYLFARQQRNELLRRSETTIKRIHHHLTNYYSSLITPSMIAIHLTRALVTQNKNRLKRNKIISKKKVVVDQDEDKIEDDEVEEVKVYRWNLNYKAGGKRFGFMLVETSKGKFFRVKKVKTTTLPIKINSAMATEEAPNASTGQVSHLSKFYQNIKRIYYTRVKHESEVDQKSSVGVFGMFRQAKGRVSKANVMLHEYNDFFEKLFNMFTWKNVWVTYSFILLLCGVLVINLFISAKTIITLFLLLQFKSGYTSGFWNRLLVSHALAHVLKATKKLSIHTPFWIVQKNKLEKLAAIIRKSCGAQLSISTLRRAHDVETLAKLIARVISKTKMQRSFSRKNWVSNLIMHSPVWTIQ